MCKMCKCFDWKKGLILGYYEIKIKVIIILIILIIFEIKNEIGIIWFLIFLEM